MANTASRPGITYEQVVAAADAMLGQGITPTIQGIRDALGSGSPNTVHRHLSTWRATLPQQVTDAPALPLALAAAFSAEIARATAEARAEVEAKLVQVQKESADLAAAGEAVEAERDGLAELVQELTAANNTLIGKSGEQANEITRLSGELERERAAGDQKTTELAQARNRIQSLDEILVEKSAAIEKATAIGTTETKGRIEAERNAAVLQAQLVAAREQIQEARAREERATAEVSEKRAVIEKLTAASAAEAQGRIEAEKAAAVFQAQTIAAQEQIREARAREEKAAGEIERERQMVERVQAEAKELRGRIEAQSGKVAK